MLDAEQSAELVRLGALVENLCEAPIDIEWVLHEDRLFLPQARPITGLPDGRRRPAEGWNDSVAGDYLWTLENFSEAIPNVMTPATWSLFQTFGTLGPNTDIPPTSPGATLAGDRDCRRHLDLPVHWKAYRNGMEIELLYVPDCPNRETARRHLDAVLTEQGLAAVVREREVVSPEEAERFGMHGSPTIRVDGRDPFAGPDARPSLSCRLYHGEHGAAGAPTVAQLAAVLAS